MVEASVVNAVRDLFEGRKLRMLVTGGTGFVGSKCAWLLAQAGQQVTVIGRNRYRIGGAWHPDIRFVPCDLRDKEPFQQLVAEHDVVIHSAALASAWGEAQAFFQANVEATRNVVEACLLNKNVKLVHVSSTAIHFEFRDKRNVPDDAPLPETFACPYAASKAEAESVVADAIQKGLDAVIVRARGVFGAGDNHLLPRILNAASKKKLPQIGDGTNVVDLTYVDNVAYALCLAAVRGDAGTVCTITNEEPVALWPTLRQICERLNLPPIRKRLSYSTALRIADIATLWRHLANRVTGKQDEPTLTRYNVGLLATTQTFSTEAARKELGYRPLVSLKQGIEKTVAAHLARFEGHASQSVQMQLFTTGYTPQPFRVVQRGAEKKKVPIHATCALLKHPVYGNFLFDTGYAMRFFESTRHLPFSIYRHITPVVTADSLSIWSQLKEQCVAPESIRGIILSHFHADHVAGLIDFPGVDIIASERAWNDVASRKGVSALLRGYVPSLMPPDTKARLRLVDHFHDPGIGPFDRTHDLFGDGSVRLVELSGHACGQIGALVQTSPTQRVFLAADSAWTCGSIRARTMPHPITYGFVYSVAEMRTTLDRVCDFAEQFPDVDIVPTHCREVARRYDFDTKVKGAVEKDQRRSVAGSD